MYDTICSPIKLGSVELKNRIIFAPTTLGVSKEEYLERMEKIAAGGCVMIVVGDVPVGKSIFEHSLYSKKGMKFYTELAERVHVHGCLLCAQLHQSDSDIKGMLPYFPAVLAKRMTADELREKLNERIGDYISSLPRKKIRSITKSFGEAAVLAKEAGFDMVQVHGDRMCGSFASSVFNHREDDYGGTLKKRSRFLLEAVSAVRKVLPELPIDVKLVVRMENPSYGKAGFTVEELETVVPLLERAGADSFHVTLANHSALTDTIPPKTHPVFGAEGCFLFLADEVRKYTQLPLCGVGGLTSPDFVEEQLAKGRIQMAAMSRQLLADPEWVNKTAAGKTEEIRKCVRCNRDCLGGLQRHEGTHCIYERSGKK